MTNLLKSLPFAAKAIAALVTPLVLTALAWLVDKGVAIDVPTPDALEALIAGAISSLAVYFTRNKTQES